MRNFRRRLGRIGCGVLVVLWFAVIILVPCGIFTLFSGGDIHLTRSAVPDDNLIRIWSVQQAKLRGLAVSTGYTVAPDANTICTVTDTRFLLWLGQAQGGRSYACYATQNGDYTILSSGTGNPPANPQSVSPASTSTLSATAAATP